MPRFAFLVAVALITLVASRAQAQTVRGTVIDDSSKVPLAAAVVTLLDSRSQDAGKPPVRTDSLGRFTLHAGDIGRYRLRVTRIGYQPVTSGNIIFSFGGHVHDVTMSMSAAPTKLGTVTITGTTRLNNLELLSHVGFDLRRSKGNGKFFDSLDLSEYKRMPVAWLLQDMPGANVSLVVGANGFTSVRMPRGGSSCTPEVWIDSFEAPAQSAGMRLQGLGADMIHAIEVYSGWQVPPPSLAGEMGSTDPSPRRCGIIAVWTKGFVKETIEKTEAKKKAAEEKKATQLKKSGGGYN